MSPSSSSSSSTSPYATNLSVSSSVTTWLNSLIADPASNTRSIRRIRYKKIATGYNHEYLLFWVRDGAADLPMFVTERTNNDPPDYVMTNAREANNLLATLDLPVGTIPQRIFARILTRISGIVRKYGSHWGNCYWFAGSVYQTLRVGVRGSTEHRETEWKHRGQYQLIGWWDVGKTPNVEPIPTTISASMTPTTALTAAATVPTTTTSAPMTPTAALPEEVDKPLYGEFTREFGQQENLDAYKQLYEKNIGKLSEVVFEDTLEKELTLAIRGLVGFILRDLAGLKAGETFDPKFEDLFDLPTVKSWLEEDKVDVES